jgi:DNA adenine methylase
MRDQEVRPFLRWAGGKRWLAPVLAAFIHPHLKGRYIEPFLGGGSVFFELAPKKALLSDLNQDLITTYRHIKKDPESLIKRVLSWETSHDSYYQIRSRIFTAPVDIAARFIYLNRTCFNGLYRTNLKGQFNVPYAGGSRTPETLCKGNTLNLAQQALKNARLNTSDFSKSISKAVCGDVVYCDPTYTVAHGNNGFIKYNETVFSWADQIRLRDNCVEAAKRGVIVIVSNADHESLRKLYHPYRPLIVSRNSLIGVKSSRTKATEFLFVISTSPKHRRHLKALLEGKSKASNLTTEKNSNGVTTLCL